MTQRFRFDIRQAGRQILAVFALLAGLNVAGWLLVTRPKVDRYAELLRTKEQHEQLEQRREQVELREAFLAGVQSAEADLHYLRDQVLSTPERRKVEVQLELARLCRQFRINLEAVNYGGGLLLNEEVERFTMDVPLEGGYAALRRFLQAVEESDHFLLVERVALAKGKEGGVMLQLNITLATYFNAPEDLVKKKREIERRGRRRRA